MVEIQARGEVVLETKDQAASPPRSKASKKEPGNYLLIKRGLYYRPMGIGYTGIKSLAGRYTLEEAKKHSGNGVRMVSEEKAAEFTPAAFPDIVIRHLQRSRDAAIARAAWYEQALRIIAGREQCVDNLMSNRDVAIEALDKFHSPSLGSGE